MYYVNGYEAVVYITFTNFRAFQRISYANTNHMSTHTTLCGVEGLDFFSLLKEPDLLNELVLTLEGVSLSDTAGEWSGDPS